MHSGGLRNSRNPQNRPPGGLFQGACRVSGLGFRAQGLGFRVQGNFRVSGLRD